MQGLTVQQGHEESASETGSSITRKLSTHSHIYIRNE